MEVLINGTNGYEVERVAENHYVSTGREFGDFCGLSWYTILNTKVEITDRRVVEMATLEDGTVVQKRSYRVKSLEETL